MLRIPGQPLWPAWDVAREDLHGDPNRDGKSE